MLIEIEYGSKRFRYVCASNQFQFEKNSVSYFFFILLFLFVCSPDVSFRLFSVFVRLWFASFMAFDIKIGLHISAFKSDIAHVSNRLWSRINAKIVFCTIVCLAVRSHMIIVRIENKRKRKKYEKKKTSLKYIGRLLNVDRSVMWTREWIEMQMKRHWKMSPEKL